MGFYTHIARGTGKEDLMLESMERELSDEDISSADSAGGNRSCRLFRWLGAFPRPIASKLLSVRRSSNFNTYRTLTRCESHSRVTTGGVNIMIICALHDLTNID